MARNATKKSAAKKSAAKKTTSRKALGDCYAGDGRAAVATVETSTGPRPVCERHQARAESAGRNVR